jgi:beta-1,4-mannosyl-glycoprotein beta-1,4-N-acetylglucosaminyltransferase
MILDCFTYFDEEIILDLRFNILNSKVDKFIITEGSLYHRGKKRKLNFDINKYAKFKQKIIYIPVEDFPDKTDPWSMLRHQRNKALEIIKNYDDDTFVMISDADEIPQVDRIDKFIISKKKFGVFEQLFFYYKLNMLNSTNNFWHGTKICKKKYLKSPDLLRGLKVKSYPWWRLDKLNSLYVIKNGGWHFSFLYNIDGIVKKISSYQHAEFDNSLIKDPLVIKSKIDDGLDIFNRGFKFNKVSLNHQFPTYLLENQEKFSKWIKV